MNAYAQANTAQNKTTACRVARKIEHDVDKLLTSGLSPARHRRLRSHVDGCPRCSDYYESARRIEEALYGEVGMSSAAIERALELTLEQPDAAKNNATSRIFKWGSLLAVTSSMSVLLAVGLVGTKQGTTPGTTLHQEPTATDASHSGIDDQLTARGMSQNWGGAGVSLFRIDPESRTVGRLEKRQPSGDADVPEEIRVNAGDVLQLAYRNEAFDYAAVVGIDDKQALQWYYPRSQTQDDSWFDGGVRLRKTTDEEPMGGAWKVEGGGNNIRLFVLFSKEAIDRKAVEAAIEPLRGTDRHGHGALSLDASKVMQQRLLLRVSP